MNENSRYEKYADEWLENGYDYETALLIAPEVFALRGRIQELDELKAEVERLRKILPGDLEAENIMCRRVNDALREQVQGLFVERDELKVELEKATGVHADLCEFVWPLTDLLHDGRPQGGSAHFRLREAIDLVRKLVKEHDELKAEVGRLQLANRQHVLDAERFQVNAKAAAEVIAGLREANDELSVEVERQTHRAYTSKDFHDRRKRLLRQLQNRIMAWKKAAEIGDCPPLCHQKHGCDTDVCALNDALEAARALEQEENR